MCIYIYIDRYIYIYKYIYIYINMYVCLSIIGLMICMCSRAFKQCILNVYSDYCSLILYHIY